MTMIQLIACIGMIAGLFMVLHVSPRELSDNLFSCLTAAPGSIRADINETTKRKKAGYLRREITEAQAVLAASGRADRFPMVCFTSLLCFALGACIAIAAGNAFLVPVLAVGLMLTPFWYVKLTAGSFKKDVAAELETALSVITTAYPSAGERTEEPVKPFALPPANKDMRRVFAYLIKHRSIARDVVAHFAKAGLLYEDAEYHNAVFVGTDTDGVPRHAHKRSANSYGKAFRLNVEGSDPRYSFHHVGTDRSLYVFEAPIDMLSFITLYPENWQRHSYVACCGTSIQPVLQMLEQVPQLDTILLCLDNDEAGHQASRRMREQLEMRYSVERLIPENKDWNDDLTLSGENAQGFSMNEMR